MPNGSAELAAADAQLARIAAALPADTTLLVTAPGAPSKPPHLQLALADGPGYSSGLLNAASTRQPGLIVLTDLTPTVLGWLGATVPPQTVGAHITRGDRGSLARHDPGADRPGHRRAGVAGHARRVLLGLLAGRRRRAGRDRAGVLGRGARSSAGAGPAGGGWPGCSPPRCPRAPSWPTWCRGRRPRTRRPGCTRLGGAGRGHRAGRAARLAATAVRSRRSA